jgi:hypothetical protein
MVSAPTQSQAPPAEVVTYDFSFSRSAMKFRWRLKDDYSQEWLCERIAGQAWCKEADGVKGNLTLVCQIHRDAGGTVTAWAPEGSQLAALQEETIDPLIGSQGDEQWRSFPQGRNTHWRLCYIRQFRAWRCRDERTGELFITNGYRGMLNLNYFDGGTHVFHDGAAYVDQQGVVRFEDS